MKLINGAVGQVGREHSLHNSVVNVIKNMCFMPGSWDPGSPTANWKDATCWYRERERERERERDRTTHTTRAHTHTHTNRTHEHTHTHTGGSVQRC